MGKKGIAPLWVVIVIAGFLIFGIPTIRNSAFAIVLNQQKVCTETPFDSKCYCPTDKQKIGAPTFGPWKCVERPLLPTTFEFPVGSWEEAIAVIEDKIGTPCIDKLAYNNPLTGSLSEANYPKVNCLDGKQAYGIRLECNKGITNAFISWFDPKSGAVYQLICNPDIIKTCPIEMRQSFACEIGYLEPPIIIPPLTYCGNNICGDSKVQVNYCRYVNGESGPIVGSAGVCTSGGKNYFTGESCQPTDCILGTSWALKEIENNRNCPEDCP